MRPHRQKVEFRLLVMLILLGLILISQYTPTTLSAPTAQGEVNAAWQKAVDAGNYHYTTKLVQTTWPVPNMYNIGLSSQSNRLFIAGQVDRYAEQLTMTIWSRGGNTYTGQNGLEIKVADGITKGRIDGSEWVEMENISSLFAPDNDVLGYLVGATNISSLGQERRAGLTFNRYRFDVDGLAVAEHMRAQMQTELRHAGKLPVGVNMGQLRHYVDMTGQGEIWIRDRDGLPVRVSYHLKFPPVNGMEWIEAEIETDFTDWQHVKQQFLIFPRLTRQNWQDIGFLSSIFLLLAATLLFLYPRRRRQYIYGSVVTLVILSMLVTPLLQSHQLYAFNAEQETAQADYQAEQQTRQQIAQVKSQLLSTTFDPTIDPLSQAQAR